MKASGSRDARGTGRLTERYGAVDENRYGSHLIPKSEVNTEVEVR